MSNAKEKHCHKITPKTINNCLNQKDKNPSIGNKLNVKIEKNVKEISEKQFLQIKKKIKTKNLKKN